MATIEDYVLVGGGQTSHFRIKGWCYGYEASRAHTHGGYVYAFACGSAVYPHAFLPLNSMPAFSLLD